MTLVMINYDNINALQLVAPNYLGSYIHQDHQCCQNIFLENHEVWTKKERKKRAKKPKKTEKKRVFTLKIVIF